MEEKTAETRPEHLAALAAAYVEGEIPAAAKVLTAGVDIGKDLFHYVVRAWGDGEESWLVTSGKCRGDWSLVEQRLCEGVFGQQGMQTMLICIDSGYRTEEVYEFCRQRPDVCRPVKGQQVLDGVPFRGVKVERSPATGSVPLGAQILWHVNNEFFKDRLHRLIHQEGRWHLHQDPNPEYLRQVASEHKVLVRNHRTRQAKEEWSLKPGYRANHWWDAEVYSLAAAYMLGVYRMGTDVDAQRTAQPSPVAAAVAEDRGSAGGDRRRGPSGSWLGDRGRGGGAGGWLDKRR
jgi:phage terminase large subunit GpA-like protein